MNTNILLASALILPTPVMADQPDKMQTGTHTVDHFLSNGVCVRASVNNAAQSVTLEVKGNAEDLTVLIYRNGVLVSCDEINSVEEAMTMYLPSLGEGKYDIYVSEGETIHYISTVLVPSQH